MWYAITTSGAAAVGFFGGLFTFKQKAQWCPACGCTLVCPSHGARNARTRSASGIVSASKTTS
jgi:hypothetical protein